MVNYRDGDAAAFDVLYARHKGGLYRYLLRQFGQQSDVVNELFQDVWMKLINSRHRYQQTAKFSTYLYHIAHNRLIDYWRSKKPETNNSLEELVEADKKERPENQLLQIQYRSQLKQQIAALPEEQREAFLLKEECLLSLEQIAQVTGVTRETVKSRLRYAMKKLKQSLVFIS